MATNSTEGGTQVELTQALKTTTDVEDVTILYIRTNDEIRADIERAVEYLNSEGDCDITPETVTSVSDRVINDNKPTSYVAGIDGQHTTLAVAVDSPDTHPTGLQLILPPEADLNIPKGTDHNLNLSQVVFIRLTDISNNIRDHRDVFNKYSDFDIPVQVISHDITIKPGSDTMRSFEALASVDWENAQKHINPSSAPEHSPGRPSLGFKKKNGTLIPDDRYDKVREILLRVKYHGLSVYQAAKSLDCSRTPIRNALTEYPERYNLEEYDPNDPTTRIV